MNEAIEHELKLLGEAIRNLEARITELNKDKERLDWLEYRDAHPQQFTLSDCDTFYKNKERIGYRRAIDLALKTQKEKQ